MSPFQRYILRFMVLVGQLLWWQLMLSPVKGAAPNADRLIQLGKYMDLLNADIKESLETDSWKFG